MRRREFLIIPASAFGRHLANGQESVQASIKVPLRFFSAKEAAVIAAATERIFPGDDSGPGAREAGVVIYIDRQLAGPYGRDKYRYTRGPWIESTLEYGYQGKATPQEIYRDGIAKLGDFTSLGTEDQDQALIAIERTMFFQMLRTHTLEGMFCDPLHGGNANMVGWQLTGYPGPLMSFRSDIEKYRGVPYPTVKPKSLEQIVGHKVQGWEDEPV